jgi:hypothetical protein
MRRVGGAECVSLPIGFYIQLRRKIKGLHTLPIILVAFDMAERVGTADQLQGRFDFVPNIPVGLQCSVRECFSVLGILEDRRQAAFVISHVVDVK